MAKVQLMEMISALKKLYFLPLSEKSTLETPNMMLSLE